MNDLTLRTGSRRLLGLVLALCVFLSIGARSLHSESTADPKDSVIVFSVDDAAKEFVVEGWYLATDGQQTPTQVTREFLTRLGTTLEVGVAEKQGLIKRDLQSRRGGGGEVYHLVDDSEERIKRSKEGIEKFWERYLGIRSLSFSHRVSADPPMGESRTFIMFPSYTQEDMKKLMDAQVQAAEKFLKAVEAIKKEIEEEKKLKSKK